MAWPEQLERILLTSRQLKDKVDDLAAQISRDYDGKSPVLLGILNGSIVFMADLMRALALDLTVDFIEVSSYEDATTHSGTVHVLKDCSHDIQGRHILIVEDIVDTGLTLRHILQILQDRRPASLRVCCLLDKPSRRQTDISVDYIGFEIPDEFVVGYGLDYAEKYRNLPYVGVLKKDAYRKSCGVNSRGA